MAQVTRYPTLAFITGGAGDASDGIPQRPFHLGITSLVNDDVYDADGKCLGEIEEIIVDARTGCIRYAVLAFGGLMGFGRQRFAVPWSALTPDSKYHRCVVDVGLMRITARPVTPADPWLQQTDQTVFRTTLRP